MILILNGINGKYLRNITENAAEKTEEVLAAVAYATESSLLFDWCLTEKIPIKFYGRLDETIPVTYTILSKFFQKASPNFVCKLVQHHHAKVIWWKGYGIYIGSANLTDSAWHKNIEAGCFFLEEEIDCVTFNDIDKLFLKLEKESTPLTKELLEKFKETSDELDKKYKKNDDFWKTPSINKWDGLSTITSKEANSKNLDSFLKEWHATLQDLRNIGSLINTEENRPKWVNSNSSAGSQSDQFLHAYYYNKTFDGKKANYIIFYESNKKDKERALNEAIKWWRCLPSAPSNENKMLNESAPYLKNALTLENINKMKYEDFHQICIRIHAIYDYARRVPNIKVNLESNGKKHSMDEKTRALSNTLWNHQASNGKKIKDLLVYILYNGTDADLPKRLWEAVTNPKYKIDGLGISSLGEIVGWAKPEIFPPRNGRTSKALKALGYDVKIHVS